MASTTSLATITALQATVAMMENDGSAHGLAPSERYRENIEQSYWDTITEILGKGHGASHKDHLPPSWQVESINWMESLFSYLCVPKKAGSKLPPLSTDWLIPSTVVVKWGPSRPCTR